MESVRVGALHVSRQFFEFVESEALPGSGVSGDAFWSGIERAIQTLGPGLDALLAVRERMQEQIDDFHSRLAPGVIADSASYEAFLRDIGYLLDEPSPFSATTSSTDMEVAELAGPQLVVPVLNVRFATNAVNARWGSLYDALYGTDAIQPKPPGAAAEYDPVRGATVIARGRRFLDDVVPLLDASHEQVDSYVIDGQGGLLACVAGAHVRLADERQFIGFAGARESPATVLLVHHGLHIEIQLDRSGAVGRDDRAGINDIVIESALTTIMDFEDSIAAVDVEDKVLAYRNWLHLMQGSLSAPVTKDGATFTRGMHADRTYTSRAGGRVTLPGRSLLFVRHVGHHMFTDVVRDEAGAPTPEGFLDAFVSALASCHDLRGNSKARNTRTGSIYAVKPKLHGPDEVALTVRLFAMVEDALGLPENTIKLGIMDEERRTTLNLAACIHAARHRVAFINTGFLDRTGDEIHTSMAAGPMIRKADMKRASWISAYESSNVAVGLACGLAGRAQIGKGMWAAPDDMAGMLGAKVDHPRAGASTAWVPSPSAATLHALHYHQVHVATVQSTLARAPHPAALDNLLEIPVDPSAPWSLAERQEELDNNVQGVLGYVVRWVDQGIGCSKVPDLTGTPLMEDRATCRISSQHVGNWLRHGVVSPDQVEESLRRMAVVVDRQNLVDPAYRPMAPGYDGHAFQAARHLLLQGAEQPSGYTEPILHHYRRAVKNGERA